MIFTDSFFYLGTTLDFLLDEIYEIKERILKYGKAVGVLNFIWIPQKVCLEIKMKLFLTIPVNLAM